MSIERYNVVIGSNISYHLLGINSFTIYLDEENGDKTIEEITSIAIDNVMETFPRLRDYFDALKNEDKFKMAWYFHGVKIYGWEGKPFKKFYFDYWDSRSRKSLTLDMEEIPEGPKVPYTITRNLHYE